MENPIGSDNNHIVKEIIDQEICQHSCLFTKKEICQQSR